MNLRKMGFPYKDEFGNTCLLYEVPADPEGMIFEIMRKPEQEYNQAIKAWQQERNRSQLPTFDRFV